MEQKEKEVQARLAMIELALGAAITATPGLREVVVKGLEQLNDEFRAHGILLERSLLDMFKEPRVP